MARFQQKYETEIVPRLAEQLGRKNGMSLPRVTKIVVSMGVGRAIQDAKILDEVSAHLASITGQKPAITKSRKSIAQFKLRKGMPIGCMVTLRGERMYEFLDRLITLVLPRVRDFRGLNPKAFDGNGNYSLGLNEQMVFPEINPDSIKTVQGLNVAIVTTARNDEEGRLLLKEFGMPYQRDQAA